MDSGTPSDRELQFDQVVSASAPPAPQPAVGTVTCQACVTPIETEYYDVNGSPFCARCRSEAEAAAVVPRGVGPLARAGFFGFGAGVAGAAIYYGVIALTNLEIGFVAILIGYMVGYAVRKGARGRGGLRFQLLGVALTYASVAMAYTPIAVSAAMSQPSAASAGGSSPE
jgi:hypothetical protein